MNILCYGDSNTYGYDPRSFFGGRYDASVRWVDILASKTGWNIKNEGMNGRCIPDKSISVPEDTDWLIIMLGTNDILQKNSVEKVANKMESFLKKINLDSRKILLIAPPPVKYGEWVINQVVIEASRELGKVYKEVAERLVVRFVDAGEWNISLAYDGVHFTEEGHKTFAEELFRELKK